MDHLKFDLYQALSELREWAMQQRDADRTDAWWMMIQSADHALERYDREFSREIKQSTTGDGGADADNS